MKVHFWGVTETTIGITIKAEGMEEEKNLAKILEGLKKSHVISLDHGGKPWKGSISHWHEGYEKKQWFRKGFFTKVTEFIEMNFWPEPK